MPYGMLDIRPSMAMPLARQVKISIIVLPKDSFLWLLSWKMGNINTGKGSRSHKMWNNFKKMFLWYFQQIRFGITKTPCTPSRA